MTFFDATPFATLATEFHTWFDQWRHNLDTTGIDVDITDHPEEMPPLIHVVLTKDSRRVELYCLFYLGAIEWFFSDNEDLTHDFFHLTAHDQLAGYTTLFEKARRYLTPAPVAQPASPVVTSPIPTTTLYPTKLILLGYWISDSPTGPYPNPEDHIDWDWDEDERDFATWYLKTGMVARTYGGYAPCRICGQNNGDSELTDGYYVWPDGLAHYISEHGIRLPAPFITHAYAHTEALETANHNRDETWWKEQ